MITAAAISTQINIPLIINSVDPDQRSHCAAPELSLPLNIAAKVSNFRKKYIVNTLKQ